MGKVFPIRNYILSFYFPTVENVPVYLVAALYMGKDSIFVKVFTGNIIAIVQTLYTLCCFLFVFNLRSADVKSASYRQIVRQGRNLRSS